MKVRQSAAVDDLVVGRVDCLLDLGDHGLVQLVHQEGALHVFPGDVVVLWLDRHVLVQADHVRPLVVVGPSEQSRQELHHGRVEFGDVAHVLEEEVVDAVVAKAELVELGHHFLQFVVPADALEQ